MNIEFYCFNMLSHMDRQERFIGGVLQEKMYLKILQSSKENTCARVSFLLKLQVDICNFIKKESLGQVFHENDLMKIF